MIAMLRLPRGLCRRMHGAVPDPFEVALVQLPQVLEAQPQHGDPAHAETPCEHRALHAPWCGDFLPEDAGTAHLDPTKTVDPDLWLNRGFRVREKARPEPHVGKAHPAIELFQKAEKVAEGDALIHNDPFELFEFRCVGGIDCLPAVDPADAERLDRGLRVGGEVLDREAGCMCTEHALLCFFGVPLPAPAG